MTCLDDATVLGLVEGRLAPPVLAAVDEHIDSCTSCREVVTLVASSRRRELAPGDVLGRYEIQELLGAGAMGRVYAAYERALDRRVAIKVLIEEDGDRLVEEARAMARLNHPNVVTVHEVATGESGAYVVMELVSGASLRSWVSSPRPWREVVRVLTDVARGLAAVHAAGVVHRDVKPDNMIVDRDGRVRVGDFGDESIAGTPAYMAPEVVRGERANAASDQYSFGAMAYELLAGRRPAKSIVALGGVPRWLDGLVRRCLAVESSARFPSMDAVAAELERHRSRRSPLPWVGAVVVASAATWFAVTTRDEPATCDVSIDVPAALQPWAVAWRGERNEACRARDTVRQRCLDERRADAMALAGKLSGPRDVDARSTTASDPRVLDAVASLPPPSECRLATSSTTPILAGQLAAARAAIANDEPAVTMTEQLVADTRAMADAPALAEALLVHGEALRGVDRLADASAVAREAAAVATRGHADLLAARAWIARVAIAGERRELDSAEDVGALAVAAVERIGSPPHLVTTLTRLRGLVAYNRGQLDEAHRLLLEAHARVQPGSLELAATESALGSVARARGDLDEAQRRHQAALDLDRKLRGDMHRDIARDLHNLAGVLRLRGALAAALATYQQALAVEIATQGERSIAAGLTHNSIGLVRLAQKDLAAARTEITTALDIFTAANHGDRAFAEHNLGLVAQAEGKHREAVDRFDRAAALYARTIGDSADAAVRLVSDRHTSVAALASRSREKAVAETPPVTPTPASPMTPAQAKPAKSKDVGVYGSAQPW